MQFALAILTNYFPALSNRVVIRVALLSVFGGSVWPLRVALFFRASGSDGAVFTTTEQDYVNYVFPALTVEESGYCKSLQQLFDVKTVVLLKQIGDTNDI